MVSRREYLSGATLLAVGGMAALAGCTSGRAADADKARVPTEPNYKGWFDGVSNYDRTIDLRGQDRVTIQVGADGNMSRSRSVPPPSQCRPEQSWCGTRLARAVDTTSSPRAVPSIAVTSSPLLATRSNTRSLSRASTNTSAIPTSRWGSAVPSLSHSGTLDREGCPGHLHRTSDAFNRLLPAFSAGSTTYSERSRISTGSARSRYSSMVVVTQSRIASFVVSISPQGTLCSL